MEREGVHGMQVKRPCGLLMGRVRQAEVEECARAQLHGVSAALCCIGSGEKVSVCYLRSAHRLLDSENVVLLHSQHAGVQVDVPRRGQVGRKRVVGVGMDRLVGEVRELIASGVGVRQENDCHNDKDEEDKHGKSAEPGRTALFSVDGEWSSYASEVSVRHGRPLDRSTASRKRREQQWRSHEGEDEVVERWT